MATRLQAGDAAPVFDTHDLTGDPVGVQPTGGRWIFLSFYRYASCPLCNLRVHAVSERVEPWRARGLDCMAVFQSPPDVMRKYVGKQSPPFPLIADPTMALYTMYGVEHSWAGFARALVVRLGDSLDAVFRKGFRPGSVQGGAHRIPADFLIGPDGRIVEAYYGKDIGDHLPLDRVDGALGRGVPA